MLRVALYGNSLVVAGMAAALGRSMGLEVLPVDAALPGAAERLGALRPDVIVFDLTAAQPDAAIALWRAHPHLLLIGIDIGTDRALVLSSQPSRVLSVEDLVHVIESQATTEGENDYEKSIL